MKINKTLVFEILLGIAFVIASLLFMIVIGPDAVHTLGNEAMYHELMTTH